MADSGSGKYLSLKNGRRRDKTRKSPNNTSTSNMIAKITMFMISLMCIFLDEKPEAIYVVHCSRLFSHIRYIERTRTESKSMISARAFHIIYITVQDRSKSSSPRHTLVTKPQISFFLFVLHKPVSFYDTVLLLEVVPVCF